VRGAGGEHTVTSPGVNTWMIVPASHPDSGRPTVLGKRMCEGDPPNPGRGRTRVHLLDHLSASGSATSAELATAVATVLTGLVLAAHLIGELRQETGRGRGQLSTAGFMRSPPRCVHRPFARATVW
jgi:hypothetical protein